MLFSSLVLNFTVIKHVLSDFHLSFAENVYICVVFTHTVCLKWMQMGETQHNWRRLWTLAELIKDITDYEKIRYI